MHGVHVAILLGMLKKRPVAIRHYASFLKQLGATTELTILYKWVPVCSLL